MHTLSVHSEGHMFLRTMFMSPTACRASVQTIIRFLETDYRRMLQLYDDRSPTLFRRVDRNLHCERTTIENRWSRRPSWSVRTSNIIPLSFRLPRVLISLSKCMVIPHFHFFSFPHLSEINMLWGQCTFVRYYSLFNVPLNLQHHFLLLLEIQIKNNKT